MEMRLVPDCDGGDCVCGNWRDDLVCHATQRTETCLGYERT